MDGKDVILRANTLPGKIEELEQEALPTGDDPKMLEEDHFQKSILKAKARVQKLLEKEAAMKKEPLHVKYRPKTWDDVIGKRNKTTVNNLKKVLKRGDVRTFLLSGPPGCGKTTLARLIAKEVGCWPSAFYETNAADERGIDAMRKIIEECGHRPLVGPCKVVLLDEAHQLTTDASTALLKITEEPPQWVYFIFATTAPEKLIQTLRDRCHHFQVFLSDPSEIKDLLLKVIAEEEISSVTETVLQEIVLAAEGSPRNALKFLDQRRDGEDEKEMLDAIKRTSVPEEVPLAKEAPVQPEVHHRPEKRFGEKVKDVIKDIALPKQPSEDLELEDFKKFGKLTYLIDQILPEKAFIILAGREGVGKSLVAMEIMKALIKAPGVDPNFSLNKPENAKPENKTDKPDGAIDDKNIDYELIELIDDVYNELTPTLLFKKYEVIRGGPVYWIDQENPGVLLHDRINQFFVEWKGKYRGKEHEIRCQHFQNTKLENKTSIKPLKEKIREFKPILLVIDSLSKIHKASEVSQHRMGVVMEKLRELLNEGESWGMSILVIHHHSKAGSIRGSTVIPANVDIEYSLKRDEDENLILKTEKTRLMAFGPIRLKIVNAPNNRLSIDYIGDVSEDIFQELKKILQDNGLVEYKTISDKLFSNFPSLKDGKLRYTLKKYADEGKIIEDSVPNPKGGKPILRYRLK